MSVLKAFLALSLLAVCVSCATYYVSPFGNDNNVGTSPSAPLRTIAKGVSKATYGELVLMTGVYSGTGNSGLYLSYSISITAQPNVIVSCQQTASQYAFSFSSSSSTTFTVANFTIRDCKTAFTMPTSSYIRTLVAQNLHITNVDLAFDTQYTNLTLDNVHINSVNRGIRVYGTRSYLTVRNSVFQNITDNAVFASSCYDAIKVANTTFSQGKSSAINTACDLSVVNVTFTSNSAINGSAISANSSTTIQVTNSTFGFNFASSNGGAIRAADKTSLAILGSTFDGNAASNGGAVSTEGTMNVALTQFYGNKASVSGGGFFCKNGQNLLTNVKFIYNSAPTGQAFNCDGCATYGSSITLTGNTGDCPITSTFLAQDRPVSLIE